MIIVLVGVWKLLWKVLITRQAEISQESLNTLIVKAIKGRVVAQEYQGISVNIGKQQSSPPFRHVFLNLINSNNHKINLLKLQIT